MFRISSIRNEYLTFVEPDYVEQRDDEFLLVWKDIPHWMVVDSDFYAFLKTCDGSEELKSILRKNKEWKKYSKSIVPAVKKLAGLSILISETSDNDSNKTEKKQYPIENIALNLTEACNLSCKLCYNADNITVNKDELSAEEIITFLENARPYLSKNPSLTILGGEPFLQPEKLMEVARFAGSRGFNTLVSTNGTLITESLAVNARKAGLQVQVSVDGHTPELNDFVRGKGCFDKLINGIQILVKNKVYTILSQVCHQDNIEFLEDFYKLTLSLNVKEARFIPLKKMGAAIKNGLKPAGTKEMLIRAVDIFKKYPEYKALAGRDTLSIIASTCMFSNRRPSCGTGLQTLLLDADGTIYPCLNTNVPELKIANIRDDGFDFGDVWNNAPVLKNVRAATSADGMNKACSNCTVRYWCLGGCHGETYINTGNLNGCAVNCADLKTSLIEMFWILSKNPAIIKPVEHIC